MTDVWTGLALAHQIAAAQLDIDDVPLAVGSPLRYTDRQLGLLLTRGLATERSAPGTPAGKVCRALGYPVKDDGAHGRTVFPNQDFTLVLHRTGSRYLASLPTQRVSRVVVLHTVADGDFVGLQVLPIGRPAAA